MITFWSWLVCFLGFSVVDADVVWEEKAAVSGGKESLRWWGGRQSRGGGRRMKGEEKREVSEGSRRDDTICVGYLGGLECWLWRFWYRRR